MGPDFIDRGFGFHPVWGALSVLVLASLVGLAVWLIMRGRSASTYDPLRQAAARYAAGKIDLAEFQRIERTLAATTPPPNVQPDAPPEPGTA
jgi:hypothetical protein